MQEEKFRKVSNSRHSENFIWIAAIFIAVVLLIAAVGKFLHPIEYFKIFDRLVSLFELFVIFMIICFRNHRIVWMGAILLFSLWIGYALFWHSVELPCGCMGAKLQLPTILTFALDVLLLILSICAALILGVRKEVLFLVLLGGTVLALGGFAFAEYIYKHFVLVTYTPPPVSPP